MTVRKVITVNIDVLETDFEESNGQKVNYQVQEIPEVNVYFDEGFEIDRVFHTPPSESGDCLNITFILYKRDEEEGKRKTKMKF